MGFIQYRLRIYRLNCLFKKISELLKLNKYASNILTLFCSITTVYKIPEYLFFSCITSSERYNVESNSATILRSKLFFGGFLFAYNYLEKR